MVIYTRSLYSGSVLLPIIVQSTGACVRASLLYMMTAKTDNENTFTVSWYHMHS